MSIRKERIKSDNKDVILKINLDSNNNRYGYQQEIDNLTEEVKTELINPIEDNEVRRFTYKSQSFSTTYLEFYFTTDGSSYENSFLSDGAGFSDTDVVDNNDNMRNSFFIVDYYDSINFFNQNKIFTTYNTKITNCETITITPSTTYTITIFGIPITFTIYGTPTITPIPKYRLKNSNKNQFYYLYVPKTLIDENLEIGNTIITGYVKFSFYNSSTGQLLLFYNEANKNITTSERLYFKVNLDLINMNWYFSKSAANYKAYQIPLTNAYSQRKNDNIDNFDNKKQEYPDGNIFNPEGQDYETE